MHITKISIVLVNTPGLELLNTVSIKSVPLGMVLEFSILMDSSSTLIKSQLLTLAIDGMWPLACLSWQELCPKAELFLCEQGDGV